MAVSSKRPTFQQGILVGLIILALIAVLIAWLDKSGVLLSIVRSFTRQSY